MKHQWVLHNSWNHSRPITHQALSSARSDQQQFGEQHSHSSFSLKSRIAPRFTRALSRPEMFFHRFSLLSRSLLSWWTSASTSERVCFEEISSILVSVVLASSRFSGRCMEMLLCVSANSGFWVVSASVIVLLFAISFVFWCCREQASIEETFFFLFNHHIRCAT